MIWRFLINTRDSLPTRRYSDCWRSRMRITTQRSVVHLETTIRIKMFPHLEARTVLLATNHIVSCLAPHAVRSGPKARQIPVWVCSRHSFGAAPAVPAN